MMRDNIQFIKAGLQRAGAADCGEEDCIVDATARVMQILQEATLNSDDEDCKDRIEFVKSFLSSDEVKKRKLQSFCLDFFDPTVPRSQPNKSGEQIQQHKYLQEDEFMKLYKFVKRHSADMTFGETVYKVMDNHGMTAPQVYKNAQLRRQDFSRATDPRNQSVTRQLAWQIIVGLHCSIDEADEVLFSAGFIRRNSRLDLTMEYFIRNGNYDIMAINEVLNELGIKVFSCYKSVRDKDNK